MKQVKRQLHQHPLHPPQAWGFPNDSTGALLPENSQPGFVHCRGQNNVPQPMSREAGERKSGWGGPCFSQELWRQASPDDALTDTWIFSFSEPQNCK